MGRNRSAQGDRPDDNTLVALVADALALTVTSPADVDALGRAVFRARRPSWPAPSHLEPRPPRPRCHVVRLLDE